MQQFEKDYHMMVESILWTGEERQTRNGLTKSLFARSMKINLTNGVFPLIQGRQMYPKGILGEFAAFIRQPTCIADFERWGCNYWKLWAKEDGSIDIDYGNAWFADGQFDRLRDKLKNDPYDRRMIINGWRPERLSSLDLPCCHYSYQFYVYGGKYLDMIWNQRSVDMMIGLPADFVLAAVWLITLANEVGLKPGTITMNLGDCHIYEEHFTKTQEYLEAAYNTEHLTAPKNTLCITPGMDMTLMTPGWFQLDYEHLQPINFELKE